VSNFQKRLSELKNIWLLIWTKNVIILLFFVCFFSLYCMK